MPPLSVNSCRSYVRLWTWNIPHFSHTGNMLWRIELEFCIYRHHIQSHIMNAKLVYNATKRRQEHKNGVPFHTLIMNKHKSSSSAETTRISSAARFIILAKWCQNTSCSFSSYILLKRSLESVALISLYYHIQIPTNSERINRSNYMYNFQRLFSTWLIPSSVKSNFSMMQL